MIHLVLGKQGCGKTIYCVKRAYEGYLHGKTIYSNVHLKFPYKRLNYDDIINCRLENAVVIIDEGHQLLPARRSLNKTSVKICDSFISMVRKKGLEVYFTTQTPRKIDIRIRDECDYIHVCSKYAYVNDTLIKCSGHEQFNKNIPVIIKVDVTEQDSYNQINIKFPANFFYKYYDTRQVILIEGID